MATVTHIIRSRYDPADRELLEVETGQRSNDHPDPWQTESSFSAQRRTRATPTFVPATVSYDEWGVPLHTPLPAPVPDMSHHSASSTAEWYHSLTVAASASRKSQPPLPGPLSAPAPSGLNARLPQQCARERTVTEHKNDWFIRNALRSDPCTEPSLQAPPAQSLADLLARDPPPPPSEGRFKPPVWLHIGPSNRGFGMLQRSGWNEGEGLGAHVAQSRTCDVASSSVTVEESMTKMQTTPEVIDLTLPDSSSEHLVDTLEDAGVIPGLVPIQARDEASAYLQRSLLTPLPIVLKADRLGIGLKAKTEGPYKRSKKRVTHSAAALAAHIRSAEEMQRKKAEVGKGKRGFAKVHKRAEDYRKFMLAYLNQ